MKYIKNKIFDFLKGITIGIANVIPGFSGGTMGVIVGIYERFITGLGDLFKHPIRVIKDLWAVFLGMLVGIVIAIFTIVKLLEIFPVPTALFFVGLILGSIPTIYTSTKDGTKITVKDIICFIVAIAVIVVLPFISTDVGDQKINVFVIILMFILGAICAAAMIIPGVSGSLVLMAFGYYLFLMTKIETLMTSITTFNFSGSLESFLVVIAFGLGAILGIVYISKIINYCLKKCPKMVYVTILGLLLASPFAIIWAVIDEYNEIIREASPMSYVVGIFTMAFGAFLAAYVPKKFTKKGKEADKIENE